MKLTGFAKGFITLVILAVIGYVVYTNRDRLKSMSKKKSSTATTTAASTDTTRTDATPTAPPAPVRQNVLASVRESKVLRVGMEPDAPPLHFINDVQQE